MTRLDGKELPYMSSNTKRIIVADAGLPPVLKNIPPEVIRYHIGDDYSIPISEYHDPEGQQVQLSINLRQANKFAYYDEEANAVLFNNDMLSIRDLGEYKITIELREIYEGAYLPAVRWEFTLIVLEPRPVEEEPEVIVPVTDHLPPFPKIKSILMDGKMIVAFSRALIFEDGLIDELNQEFKTDQDNVYEEPIYNPYAEMVDVSFIPGNLTELEDLGEISREILSLTSTEMHIQLNFTKPLEISQQPIPDSLRLTLRMSMYKD